jgi:hypothetical protein
MSEALQAGQQQVATHRRRWLLPAALAAALLWRVPMWTGCTDALDSDVACNGLTLKGMLEGKWRWHLPGIHYMGVTEVVLALPAAALFGANAYTLTTGPLIAYGLYMVAIYALVRRLYGETAGLWSLAATAFVSPEVLFWSTFPIGGHLLIAFWHVAALLVLLAYLRSGKRRWLALLGVWSGLGLYTYQMYLYTIALVAPALLARAGPAQRRISLAGLALVFAGFAAGWAPHWIGKRADDWDVYGSQVSLGVRSLGDWRILWLRSGANTRVLADCLPKLFTGLRGAELLEPAATLRWVAGLATALLCCVVAALYYARACRTPDVSGPPEAARARHDARARKIVRALVALTPPVVVGGFLIHPAVVNELNTRYLIYLLAWWPVAFGAVASGLQSRGRYGGAVLGASLVICFTALAASWCIDGGWRSGHKPAPALVAYLRRQPSFEYFYAGYWDAYRFTFLSGERVRGVPVHPRSVAGWLQYDKLRIPSYAERARRAKRVGVIVRTADWPESNAVLGPPVWSNDDYRVYLLASNRLRF